MLKKRNIAMVMAAATVATSVAPVFAAVEKKEVDEATLVAKVQELLNTKYSDAEENGLEVPFVEGETYTNSVYKIQVNGNDVKSISQLKNLIENAKVSNEELVVVVTDKGHATVDGKVVASEKTKYDYYTNLTSDIDTSVLSNYSASIKEDSTSEEATIVLANNTEIDLVVGDYVLDLAKPVDANGNLVDTTNLTSSVKKSIAGFKKHEDDKATVKPMPSRIVEKYSFNGAKFTELKLNGAELITKDGYTKDGAEFVNTIISAKATKEVIKDGVKYELTGAKTSEVVTNKEGGYKFEVTLVATKTADKKAVSNVKITITGDVQKHLSTLRNAIETDTPVTDLDGKTDKIAGDDRFQTAAKISQETYAADAAKAVILVGEEAIVDGLAAAPLAKKVEAPILLAKKDEVPVATMNEIKRATANDGKGAKVYLVGGENNISKEVEKQLITELNVEIVRIAGDDRFETSTKIAKEVVKDVVGVKDAFVVGGDGLADAMSVASIATSKNAPIIVTPAAGLTKDAKDLINKDDNVVVVGGQSKVSTDVLKDIKSETEQTTVVERIAGEDRAATNAAVIEKYSKGAAKVFVAKNGYGAANGDAQLVDALAVAPLAAKEDAMVILAGEGLTKAQEKVVKDSGIKGKLTQIGGGVGFNVIQKLVDLLK